MESIMEVIYKLTSPSGKYYIGRSKNYDNRMKQHESRSKTSDEIVLYKAIRKYGWDNFTKEILAEVSNSEAVEIEEFFIEKYNAVTEGYNMTYKGCGGDIWEGRRDTKEYEEYCILKSKQSSENNGFKGKRHTLESLKKMSHPDYKNGMFGKNHSESTKGKMKQKAAGRFSLPWYIDRYGKEEGTTKNNNRCKSLSERKLKRDEYGRYVK